MSFWYEGHRAGQAPSSPVCCFQRWLLADAWGGLQDRGKDVAMFAGVVSQPSAALSWYKTGCVGTMHILTSLWSHSKIVTAVCNLQRPKQEGRSGMEWGLICYWKKVSQDSMLQNLAFKNLKTTEIAATETWDSSLLQLSSWAPPVHVWSRGWALLSECPYSQVILF